MATRLKVRCRIVLAAGHRAAATPATESSVTDEARGLHIEPLIDEPPRRVQ
jgi:hypothetical protein